MECGQFPLLTDAERTPVMIQASALDAALDVVCSQVLCEVSAFPFKRDLNDWVSADAICGPGEAETGGRAQGPAGLCLDSY